MRPLVLGQINGNLVEKVARVGCKRGINRYAILKMDLDGKFRAQVRICTVCGKVSFDARGKPLEVPGSYR